MENVIAVLVSLGMLALTGWLIWAFIKKIGRDVKKSKEKFYCPNCGNVSIPKKRTKGSFLIEFALWCCIIVPGLIYSLWRLSSKYKACPTCGAVNMIPADSPKARAALQNAK